MQESNSFPYIDLAVYINTVIHVPLFVFVFKEGGDEGLELEEIKEIHRWMDSN